MTDYLSEFLEAMEADGVGGVKGAPVPDSEIHRFDVLGDKKGSKKGWYVLHNNGGAPRGTYGTFGGGGFKREWTVKGYSKMTKEEKAASRKKSQEAKKKRDKDLEKNRLASAKLAKERHTKADPASPDHPYLVKKQIDPHEIKQEGDTLIVPLYRDNIMRGLQEISLDGSKVFQKHTDVTGSYYPIKGVDKEFIIICEGFATGASIAQATGMSVVVAFNAKNLVPVAKNINRDNPDSVIIIARDGDQWTFKNGKKPEGIAKKDIPGDDERWEKWRKQGLLIDTGEEAGKQAASSVRGFSVSPGFSANHPDKASDFNDLHVIEGIDAVSERILSVISSIDLEALEVGGNHHALAEDGVQAPDLHPLGDEEVVALNKAKIGELGLPIHCLGYDGVKFSYFSLDTQQIIHLNPAEHNYNMFTAIMGKECFDSFRATNQIDESASERTVTARMMDQMMRGCKKKGVFDLRDKVRGCGVWKDANRIIVHAGEKLLVNGEVLNPRDVEISKYAYTAKPALFHPSSKPLTSKEAQQLQKMCAMPVWKEDLSAKLLAGWIVVAPLCGALSFRPHIWLTGQSGAGKSTVLNRIVKPAIGSMALSADGGSTESGIRNTMGDNCLPILFDEAEGKKGGRESNMTGVLSLVRLSSTGGRQLKYQQDHSAQFAFCLSSINPPIEDYADETRISKLYLCKNISENAYDDYQDMLCEAERLLTPEFSVRLLARSVSLFSVLEENIKKLQRAAVKKIKSPREADMISTMLAGYWLLMDDREIPDNVVDDWINNETWDTHTAISEKTDPERLIAYIMSHLIRVDASGVGTKEMSIGDLVTVVIKDQPYEGVTPQEAAHALKNRGIKYMPKRKELFISSKHDELLRVLKNTIWHGGLGGTIKQLEGSVSATANFGGGVYQKGHYLPKSYFVEEKKPKVTEETLNLEGDDND